MSANSSKKKILLLGRAGTGKSSIRTAIFEGEMPLKLLTTPLKPTRGLSPHVYSWIDLELGIFDSSGQELNFLLNDEEERALAFKNSDIICYIFDYTSWINNQELIINEILKIKKIIEDSFENTTLILFLHKIDLIREENLEEQIGQIKEEIETNYNFNIYFTSLYPKLIYNTYNALYQIISSFSEETQQLKSILDDNLKDLSNTLSYATNRNNSIIVQSMTRDFDTNLINYSHNLTAGLNQSFEEMTQDDNIEHIIISSSNNLNIIMKNLGIKKFDLKNLVFISQGLSVNKLIWLIGDTRLKLNNYIYKGKI